MIAYVGYLLVSLVALTAANTYRNRQGIAPMIGACGADDLYEGAYLPHPDCTLFYQCEHGIPHTLSCPPGLYFNAIENICDWPLDSGCVNGAAPPQDDARPLPPPPPEADPPAVQVPGEYSSCQSPIVDYTVLLPHPQCTLFYKCVHGIPWVQSCPDGLEWNVAETSCDWPGNANCVENAAPPQPDAMPL